MRAGWCHLRLKNRRGYSCGLAGVLLAGCAVWCAAGEVTSRAWLGLPDAADAGPMAREKAVLGQLLFGDKRLSSDGAMACATCHDPRQGFTQHDRATPAGRDGRALRRNAPSLYNVAFAAPLMHDGAAPSLAAQVLTPLLDRNEMANATFEDLEQRLSLVPEYAQSFRALFGGPPTMARVGEALAAYERTLVSGNSAFDRWRFGGEPDALSAEAQRGFALFAGKANCTQCHTVEATTALFSDNRMHNTGAAFAGMRPASPASAERVGHGPTVDFAAAGDRGRHEITGDPADLHRYRTPSLRNVALTAPYMHDGSMRTLDDVVRFYNAGGGRNANLDTAIVPLGLDDRDVSALVAFLKSLTGDNAEDLAAAGGASPEARH